MHKWVTSNEDNFGSLNLRLSYFFFTIFWLARVHGVGCWLLLFSLIFKINIYQIVEMFYGCVTLFWQFILFVCLFFKWPIYSLLSLMLYLSWRCSQFYITLLLVLVSIGYYFLWLYSWHWHHKTDIGFQYFRSSFCKYETINSLLANLISQSFSCYF